MKQFRITNALMAGCLFAAWVAAMLCFVFVLASVPPSGWPRHTVEVIAFVSVSCGLTALITSMYE
jgi:hypothetical protein